MARATRTSSSVNAVRIPDAGRWRSPRPANDSTYGRNFPDTDHPVAAFTSAPFFQHRGAGPGIDGELPGVRADPELHPERRARAVGVEHDARHLLGLHDLAGDEDQAAALPRLQKLHADLAARGIERRLLGLQAVAPDEFLLLRVKTQAHLALAQRRQLLGRAARLPEHILGRGMVVVEHARDARRQQRADQADERQDEQNLQQREAASPVPVEAGKVEGRRTQSEWRLMHVECGSARLSLSAPAHFRLRGTASRHQFPMSSSVPSVLSGPLDHRS